jgi:hypothetical protein
MMASYNAKEEYLTTLAFCNMYNNNISRALGSLKYKFPVFRLQKRGFPQD